MGWILQCFLQVAGQSTSISGLPTQSLEHSNSVKSGTAETKDTKTPASSSTTGGILESTRESLFTHTIPTPDAPELKADGDEQGSMCESSKTFGASRIVDSLDTDHQGRQNDYSPQDALDLETLGKNQGEIMLNEVPTQIENMSVSNTSSESVPLKYLEVVNQTKPSSALKVTTISNEVRSLEITQSDLEEPVVHCKKDDMVADNLVISLPASTNSNTSSSSPKSSTRSNGDNESSTDSLGGKEAVVTKSVLSDEATIPVSTSSISESALKHEGERSEDNTGLVSHTATSSKDKPIPELNRTKSTAARTKKIRKEFLQKADAAGTTSDLYMAYKGPEGKKGTVDSSQSMVSTSNINLKQVPIEAQDDIVSSEKDGHSKAEPDDWEKVADISTSKLETVGDGKKVHGELKHLGVMAKKYTRDSLLKLSEQCIDLPESFEITSHVANLMVSNVNVSREPHPSPGRSIESAKRKCASKRSKGKEQKGNVHQNGPPA